MAKKLTEIQKKEILEGFCACQSILSLSKTYGFTPSTITRAVKSFLTEEEYIQLKLKRGKEISLNKKNDSPSNEKQNGILFCVNDPSAEGSGLR